MQEAPPRAGAGDDAPADHHAQVDGPSEAG
jgi:hypothetical protein